MKNLVLSFILIFSSFSAFAEKVLIVSPEQKEFFQTGGLADATTGLAIGLKKTGINAEVLMPYYTRLDIQGAVNQNKSYDVNLDYFYGHANKKSHFSLFKSTGTSVPTLFLKHESHGSLNYFENREVKGYGPDPIIGEAVGAFAKAAADHILASDYNTVILNDWSTGLIAYHLKKARDEGKKTPKVIFAIHNLAYQGLFPVSLYDFLGLPRESFKSEEMEFWGKFGMLKAGLIYSDLIYTVSPQYAQEIMTSLFGAGLDGVLRKKFSENRLLGVLNGITTEEWSPSTQVKGLHYTFTKDDISGKTRGKLELQKEFSLTVSEKIPVFVLTSRLAEQKGTAYFIDAIEASAKSLDAQFIVIGDGDREVINKLKALQEKYPNKVRYDKFSHTLEKKLIRYGDFFVNLSWFEPCGLNQLYALLNGTKPVVSAVGGLLNSVKDNETGYLVKVAPGKNGANYDVEATRKNIILAFEKAATDFKDKEKMNQMQRAGMSESHSWIERVRSEVIPMLKYVATDSSKKMTFTQFKDQHKDLSVPMCSRVFAGGF